MLKKKKITLERLINNISKYKIIKFCNLMENSQIMLSDEIFKLRKILELNSKEEKYFLDILLNFSDKEDLIILLEQLIELKNIQNLVDDNTKLAWSSPIKYHEKIDQTDAVFLKMINEASNSIILVGYAMIDEENKEIFEALKAAAKERNVKIKIIFDKATTPKKWGKWTKSPKNIISKVWDDIEYFPEIFTYDNPHSSLHAKLLIIDDKKIFVTSANFTDRAMTRNLEMGIIHEGKAAKDASEIFKLLIKKKIIREIEYD